MVKCVHNVDMFTYCSLVTMGLIYETNVRPKIGRTVVSTQNLEFINMDVSGGYDQISRQVWARVRKFFESAWTCVQYREFQRIV